MCNLHYLHKFPSIAAAEMEVSDGRHAVSAVSVLRVKRPRLSSHTDSEGEREALGIIGTMHT